MLDGTRRSSPCTVVPAIPWQPPIIPLVVLVFSCGCESVNISQSISCLKPDDETFAKSHQRSDWSDRGIQCDHVVTPNSRFQLFNLIGSFETQSPVTNSSPLFTANYAEAREGLIIIFHLGDRTSFQHSSLSQIYI